MTQDSEFWSGILDPIKDGFSEGLKEAGQDIKDWSVEMFYLLGESLKEGITKLMQELIDLILTTPLVGDNEIIVALHGFVRVVSFSLIGLMFVWEGFKKTLSADNVIRSVEFKTMMVRLIYGIILAVFSLDIVDILIQFNNSLVSTLKDNFEIAVGSTINTSTVLNYILTMSLVIVQLVLGVKIAVQYFMRLGEIWLMAILGPLAFTLWINPNMNNLGGWLRRLASTIFSQTVWALILVLYTAMVSSVALTGTVWGTCMSIALLLIMLNTPAYLRQFLDAQQDPIQLINQAKNQTMGKIKTVRTFKTAVTKKVGNWFKP